MDKAKVMLEQQKAHFLPLSGWMNDPNGLIFHDGLWHLFFQYLELKHWGHAVSTDLVRWELWPVALSPVDLGEIWSGSVVHDMRNTSGLFPIGSGGLIAIFTLRTADAQRQGLAYSIDAGRSWTQYRSNPVLCSDERDFRDPKVFWYGPRDHWVMVLATGTDISIYTSRDLKSWELASRFGADVFPQGAICECPDLFDLAIDENDTARHWVMNVSLIHEHPRVGRTHETYYVCGDFDGTVFRPSTPLRKTSFGPDDYAMITFAGTGSRRVGIGWMSNWAYANSIHIGEVTGGGMTLPRELTLRKTEHSVELIQQPAIEIEKAYGSPATWQAIPIEKQFQSLPIPNAEVYWLAADIEVSDAEGFEFCAHEGATVGYDRASGVFFVERGKALGVMGLSGFSGRWEAPAGSMLTRVRFRMFVDASSVEVFFHHGQFYFAAIISKRSGSPLRARAQGGTAIIRELQFAEFK